MRVVIQKFGGTSVATDEARGRVAGHVAAAIADGLRPVVVVSAMGRAGDPYATDTLLGLVPPGGSDVPSREADLLTSCGELISAVVLADALRAHGLSAEALSGGQAGIITDENYNHARILRIDSHPILRRLEAGTVPVVAGFQGVSEGGEVTTLGRGGSDTTAVALGAALAAEVVEIYTDVDGVKTADPRLVPDARTLDVVTYEEIAQMAHQGARVVHPQAIEIARHNSIPVRVRSTFSPAPGTLVTFRQEMARAWLHQLDGRVITGVTYMAGLAQIAIRIASGANGAGAAADAAAADAVAAEAVAERRAFRGLADAGVSVDLISVSPGLKMFCVEEALADRAVAVLRGLGLDPQVTRGCAKVSVVGFGMRGLPGVMAGVVEALSDVGVRILQTADSHVTISCLVRGEDLDRAVRALHGRFGLDAPAPEQGQAH
jgi:aspartate kinase